VTHSLSVCLSACLSVNLPAYLSVCLLSVRRPVCLPFSQPTPADPPVCKSVHVYVHPSSLFLYPSVCLTFSPSSYPYVSLSLCRQVYLSACPYVCPSVSPRVCLFIQLSSNYPFSFVCMSSSLSLSLRTVVLIIHFILNIFLQTQTQSERFVTTVNKFD